MARIAVIGGSGYAGRHIVAEAVSRGHTVLSIARRIPSERHEGALYVEGSLTDVPDLLAQLEGVDVVVSAVAARGEMEGLVRPNVAALVSRRNNRSPVSSSHMTTPSAKTSVRRSMFLPLICSGDA